MSLIEFKNIVKSYKPGKNVIQGLNLDIEEGEFVALLGPSGCGKTTLLKMVNKLIKLDSGNILVKGKDINQWNTIDLRRNIGYVIQQIGLFPHMTIEDNINYVLTLKKSKMDYKSNRAKELIGLVGLTEEFLYRYPRELSGGQKQRIGVARALAANPDIILMDEPFGAVDEIARTHLQDELINIQQKLKKTIIFVTHDIQEALKLGSKIVLLNEGKIEQAGNKEELIFDPSSDFVKDFIGLKGFKAVLDDEVMQKIYMNVLNGELNMKELYEQLYA